MKIGVFLNSTGARRILTALGLIGLFLLLATIVPPPPGAPPRGEAVARLTAIALPLEDGRPDRRRVGALLYRRGWALDSDDPRFGAVSAMQVENGRVTALSDAGTLFEFPLPGSPGGERVRIRPLPHAPGVSKRGRDTESLVLLGPRLWIGFEAVNAVKRLRRADLGEESAARPAGMRRWGGNSGPEAMVRLPDGRFLVFSEGRDDGRGFSQVLLFDGDPAAPATRAIAMRYRRPPGFRVTDAALLPDGRLLILNRRFGWLEGLAASLVIAPLPPARANATIAGREVARLEPPLTVENMEALSVAREQGRTIVRIASDDNFMPVLRTVLLEFELTGR
jgi:hypothetical protein